MTNEEKNKLMTAFTAGIIDGIQEKLLALPSEVKGRIVEALDQLASQLEVSMHTEPVEGANGAAVEVTGPEGNDIADAIEEAKSFLPTIPDVDLTAEMYRRGLMPVTRS